MVQNIMCILIIESVVMVVNHTLRCGWRGVVARRFPNWADILDLGGKRFAINALRVAAGGFPTTTFCPGYPFLYAHTLRPSQIMDIAALIDYFEIGCPCCQLEYQLWFITGVPPAPHRNPQSDPKGALHRELMQCQFCFKSRREGVQFFRCGGCSIEIYCVRGLLR